MIRYYVTASRQVSCAYNANDCMIENVDDYKYFQIQSKYALQLHMILIMRKPAFCICENKDREADQRL